jgi:Uma2 family endonuclease
MLPSFEEYVLIAQEEARVDVFRKTSEDSWQLSRYHSLEAKAKIESLGIELPLAELYAGIEWTSSPST